MKRAIILYFTLVLMSLGAVAQQYRFIYLQTENQQTFYVKLNEVHYSSSPSGYLIIPKLTDGTYRLLIGFPRNEYPMQEVTCVINGKDEGYLLKNLGNESWGLFNLNTFELAKADPGEVKESKVSEKDESFEGVLSDVVETDLKKPKSGKRKKGQKEAEPEVLQQSISTEITRVITKHKNGKEQYVYAVMNDGVQDSVEVVWLDAESAKEKKVVLGEKPVSQPVVRFEEPVKQAETDAVKMVNSNCKKTAGEKEFLKLRKNMAAKSSQSAMIEVAQKAFKKHCYTTEQINGLAVLLTSDDMRYKLLDAAYPFTEDSDNFSSLRSLLKDSYYQNRFDAMLKK